MGAVIGEVAVLVGPTEVGPGAELAGQGFVHGPDIGDGEFGQGLVGDGAGGALDADDFDVGVTSMAGNGRGGYEGLTRDDVELIALLTFVVERREPPGEFLGCLVGLDVPALCGCVPLGA